MKKAIRFLSLVLTLAMMLSLGCVSFAADDWSEYQQYVYAFAADGAPTPEDAESMKTIIDGCADMDDIRAASEIQVFFAVLGALDYDAWLAAGKPAGGIESSGSASGEASDEASGEASGENRVVSVTDGEVVYVSDGVEKTAVVGEGQYAFLSVGGVNKPLAVGSYDGTVTIDVVDPIFESAELNKADKDVDLGTELFSALYLTEDGLQENQSILGAAVGGQIGKDSVSGVSIESEEGAVAGIRVGGEATVEINDVDIKLSGVGGNDFMGEGAALAATDGAHVIAHNVNAEVSGFVRGCTFAGGYSTLEVYDSNFVCDAGEYDPNGSAEGAGMSQPPKGLGVFGNARSNNLVHWATEYFENCTFTNRNWGCLGVDAVEEGYLTCVGCEINVTECGYGAYSIGACTDTFTDCVFNINDGVVAFVAVNGTVILNGGTVANSNRYGIVTHQAMNTVSTVKVLGEGTELNAAYCGIMVKGRSADVEIGDGAVITASETGVLVQAQDNDDTGAGTVNAGAEVPVYIHDTALTGDIVMSMAPTDTAAMNVTLENATVDGAISLSNATNFITEASIEMDDILNVGRLTNEYGPREDACYLNVELRDGAVWNVTETSYVTTLTVDESSVVNGVVTECDGYCVVEPAEQSASGSSVRLNLNGESLGVLGIEAEEDNGSFRFDLSALLNALGLDLSYDEENGTVTVDDEGGLVSSILG